jgi:hypothetical protein
MEMVKEEEKRVSLLPWMPEENFIQDGRTSDGFLSTKPTYEGLPVDLVRRGTGT